MGILYPQLFEICVKSVKLSLLPCLSLALTGNVLRIETCLSMFGGSHKSLSDQGKRGEKGK